MNNNVVYQHRVRRAAQQLSGSPTMRQFRYRNHSGGTLGDPASTRTSSDVRSPTSTRTDATTTGNRTSTSTDGSYNNTTNNYAAGSCNCPHSSPRNGGSPRLRAVRSQKLGSYRLVTGVRSGLSAVSGIGIAQRPVMALVPVSDRSAVTAAVKMFAARRANQLQGYRQVTLRGMRGGLGDTKQASGAVGGAATGAETGTMIFPGIGTVIGAVIGAVVGWLAGQSKPVRASAAEVAQCRSSLTEYMTYASQSPNAGLPLDWNGLLQMNWCFMATYGGEIALKDPRWFNQGFEAISRPMAIEIVKKIYETPVGAVVDLGSFSVKDSKGKAMHFDGFSFVNPTFTNLKDIASRYFAPADLKLCQANSGKGAGGCAGNRGRAEWQRILYDLLCWAARTTLPNISESDLKAASEVAATLPSTSAKDVVSAVETILKRPVVKDETAALLTPQAAVPGQAAPAPQIPVTAIAPLIPQVQANPIDTATGLPAPIANSTSLPSPGASAGGGGYATLPSGAPSSTTLAPIAAGLPGGNSLWIAGGLGILAVMFATTRPMKGSRR